MLNYNMIGIPMQRICADCMLQGDDICTHNYPELCVHCHHRDDEHFSDDKGQCGICDCDGLETP